MTDITHNPMSLEPISEKRKNEVYEIIDMWLQAGKEAFDNYTEGNESYMSRIMFDFGRLEAQEQTEKGERFKKEILWRKK